MLTGRMPGLIRLVLATVLMVATTACENPVEAARQEGYDKGYEQGKVEGYEEGKEEALDCVSGYESAEEAYDSCS